jgi:hypothetical protein
LCVCRQEQLVRAADAQKVEPQEEQHIDVLESCSDLMDSHSWLDTIEPDQSGIFDWSLAVGHLHACPLLPPEPSYTAISWLRATQRFPTQERKRKLVTQIPF